MTNSTSTDYADHSVKLKAVLISTVDSGGWQAVNVSLNKDRDR